MINFELISYIRKQIQNNVSKDLIISKLISVGWRLEDINEGLSNIELELKPKVLEIKKTVDDTDVLKNKRETTFNDRYHEPIEGDNLFEVKKEPQKTTIFNTEEQKIETPKLEISKTETPKVWTPIRVPVKEKLPTESVNSDIKTETTKVEIQNLELSPLQKISNGETNRKEEIKKEESIPTVPPKVVINSFESVNNRDNLSKSESPIISNEPSKDSLTKNLPKIPMLSSYKSDLLSVSKIEEENAKKKSFKIIKWFLLALVICIISLITWALVSGYINIKNIDLSFIRKNPKVLLLNKSKVLSSLKSYKTETNIEISSPSFSNITSGLISGEAISSLDKDSILINTLGIINQSENNLLSDNFVTIKNSMLQNYITADIKNDNSDLYVSVSDFSQIIKENIPESSVIKINEQQFELIPSLFSPSIESLLKKINIYKILSSGMPSYINNETLNTYNEFINNVEIIKKEQEEIKGINTYHYSISTDRQLAKNLLSKISDNFVLNLSEGDKENLAQIINSVIIDSFDVWIGKGDNNIYQYNVVINIPLSKIIGFEDKSIEDNTISINWKTTYYDFNITNDISIPNTSTTAIDFVNSIKSEKIKNDVSSFKQLATDLFNIEGTYGKKSNSSGSCINPISGSLFSPTGHIKGATTEISSLSVLLNKILGITKGSGFCYSTPKAWSFTVPIADNYDETSIPEGGYTSFFCIDSTGSTENLVTPPTGVICLPKVDL